MKYVSMKDARQSFFSIDEIFYKLSLHDREVRTKYRVSHHDGISTSFCHFDRRFGINRYRNDSAFVGVSRTECLISMYNGLIDKEACYVCKAT